MKKLLMFLCCLCIASGAWAVSTCRPIKVDQSVNLNAWWKTVADEEKLELDSGYILVCDADLNKPYSGMECQFGTVVFVPNSTLRTTAGVYQCYDNTGDVDPWKFYADAVVACDSLSSKVNWDHNGDYLVNSNYFTKMDGNNAYVTKLDKNIDVTSRFSNGQSVCRLNAEQKACFELIKTGAAREYENNTCVCTRGLWNKPKKICDTSCEGTESGKTKTENCPSTIEHGNQCKHTCNDGKWSNWTLVSCTNGYVLKNNKCVKQTGGGSSGGNGNGGGSSGGNGGGQGAAAAHRKACTDTGGSWTSGKCVCDSSKYLEPLVADRTCRCVNGYVFQGGVCVITSAEQRRQICESAAASGAYWSDVSGRCLCEGDNQTFNYDTRLCEQDPEYAKCKSAKNTRWENGTCVCTQSGYEWTGEKCDESAESIAAREEAARRQRVTQSSAAIENASKKLDDIMAGLKVSVWKTSEGNFNGARLASDSIAGVVLGTAGGLITSSIVKKNQVKSGFEDISCTVGGQRVADWGDEFTVGIR